MITGMNERRAQRSDLEGLALFGGIAEGELDWVAAHGRVVDLDEGTTIVEEDSPADEMIVVLKGAAEFDFSMGPQHVILRRFGPGDVTGVLPYSRMTKVPGTAVAVEDSTILLVHRDSFPELVKVAPALGQRVERPAARVRAARDAAAAAAAGVHEMSRPSARPNRPTYVGIGAQKCASTWLHRILANAYYKQNKLPDADLATAEALYLEGDLKQAQIFAKRALPRLKSGSPNWIRAGDIVNFKIPG